MKEQHTTERYTLADLENWSKATRNVEPPIRLGVLGDPVAHSLSPQMQNAALSACKIEMQYARFHVLPNELEDAMRMIGKIDFVGLSLTVPHKIPAINYLQELD